MDAILNSILEFLGKAEGQAVIVAVVVEFALRLFKSEKPLSILYIVSGALKKIGDILVKIAGFLDKILPQKLK